MKNRPSSIAFETLGCKLNFSETSSIRREFANQGYTIREFDELADIYVINTCSVTNDANSACRKTVRQARRRNPDARIAVIGCYAQLEPEEIASIDGVDLILGAKEKFRLPELITDDLVKQEETLIYRSDVNEAEEFHHAISSDDRTRAFLKIQDGCNYSCAFCTIPLARGKSRSPEIETVLKNAEQLVDEGYKEIVVTGVNAGDFGVGRDDCLADLLEALVEVDGLNRLRVSSIEPNLLDPRIVDLAAESPVLQPHFHLPLQSGSNTLLGRMRRRYRRELYEEKIHTIRDRLPDACIGADLITGHPGESDELFDEGYRFVADLEISYLHVFTYSERPETDAVRMEPVVPVPTRKRRTHRLRNLSDRKRRNFDSRFLGQTRPVLFESAREDGTIQGWSDNYIRVTIEGAENLENRLLPVTLAEMQSNGTIRGELNPTHYREERVIRELTTAGV
ncbi:MAG: tRNA (N(6)-L-threonylcarbamoyladenosine(37)-C(2))-methylthiotransferase MtaB [Bacteroidota bacterium]